MRYLWMIVATIAFIAAQVALGAITVVDQNGNVLSASGTLTVTVPDCPTCPVCPPCNDPDSDGDGVPDSADICPGFDDAIDQDADGIPDGCDADRDGDGVPNSSDNCPDAPHATPDGCQAPVQGDIAAAIMAMAPAQHATQAVFKKIPGSEIDVLTQCSEFPYGDDILCAKSYNAFRAWVGGAWNWVDWEFIVPGGGGHGDYWGNEVYRAQLQAVNGSLEVNWSRPIDPSPPVNPACKNNPASGPFSSHSYASPVYVEKQGEYFHGTTFDLPVAGCEAEQTPSVGAWVTDKQSWKKVIDGFAYGYGRSCYLRGPNKIFFFKGGGSRSLTIDPADGYSVVEGNSRGYVSNSGYFDTAADQVRNICYEYTKDFGIRGFADGITNKVFQSTSISIAVPSLSVEHSTGNLVIVGTDGYAKHIDVTSGAETDISATSGIPNTGGASGYLYGKFDMIETIPCVGIGVADGRSGVYLMTLPSSVCTLIQPIAGVEPPPAQQEDASVVFSNSLTSAADIPTTDYWKANARMASFGDDARAEFDPIMKALKLTRTDGADSSGLLMTNFSEDYSLQFGEGDAFAVEFEYRLNCEAVYMDCDPQSPAYQTDRRPFIHRDTGRAQGAKIAIIAEGAVPSDTYAPACDVIQIVINQDYGTLRAFNDCGKYTRIEKKAGSVAGSAQLERNSGEDYSCLRFPDGKSPIGESYKLDGTGPNCAYLEPDQWMRIKAVVHVGTWGQPDTRFQLFFALKGDEYGEVIDQMITVRSPQPPYIGYGAIHFQMHSTKSQGGIGAPDRVSWYRNLRVSRIG